jgi:hypothetical protein
MLNVKSWKNKEMKNIEGWSSPGNNNPVTVTECLLDVQVCAQPLCIVVVCLLGVLHYCWHHLSISLVQGYYLVKDWRRPLAARKWTASCWVAGYRCEQGACDVYLELALPHSALPHLQVWAREFCYSCMNSLHAGLESSPAYECSAINVILDEMLNKCCTWINVVLE